MIAVVHLSNRVVPFASSSEHSVPESMHAIQYPDGVDMFDKGFSTPRAIAHGWTLSRYRSSASVLQFHMEVEQAAFCDDSKGESA